jgi:hypothetical protein
VAMPILDISYKCNHAFICGHPCCNKCNSVLLQ